MLPWAIWTVLVAAINLTLFVAVRGRWGGEAPLLVVAALVGTALGNLCAGLLEIDLPCSASTTCSAPRSAPSWP